MEFPVIVGILLAAGLTLLGIVLALIGISEE